MLERLENRIRKLGIWLHFFLLNTFFTFGLAVIAYTAHVCISKYYPIDSEKDGAIIIALKAIPKEFAVALLIAYILGFSVEYWTRQRHEKQIDALAVLSNNERSKMLKDISTGVFKAVYGKEIPEPVFDQINRHIIESKFFRVGYELELMFEEMNASDSEVKSEPRATAQVRTKITQRHRFETHNLEDMESVWKTNIVIDERNLGNATGENCHFIRFAANIFEFDDDEPNERMLYCRLENSDVNNKLQFESGPDTKDAKERDIREIVVLGNKETKSADKSHQRLVVDCAIPKRGKAIVDVVYEQYHPTDGADAVVTIHPADGLKISVLVPNQDYDVIGMSMHPEDELNLSIPGSIIRKNFQIQHALLPGQGFYYRWTPRNNV